MKPFADIVSHAPTEEYREGYDQIDWNKEELRQIVEETDKDLDEGRALDSLE